MLESNIGSLNEALNPTLNEDLKIESGIALKIEF